MATEDEVPESTFTSKISTIASSHADSAILHDTVHSTYEANKYPERTILEDTSTSGNSSLVLKTSEMKAEDHETAKEKSEVENHEDETEENMQKKDEVSVEEYDFTSQGSRNMESKLAEDLMVKSSISTCRKEEVSYMDDVEIRGNTSNNVATESEEDQSSTRTAESAKEDSSLQVFQIISQADTAADEANNPELLPVKDLSAVTSDEIPKAVIPEVAEDVIWEQKEVPITQELEEIKKRNDELPDAANLVCQASEENSNYSDAIVEADNSTVNTNISRRMSKKEVPRLEDIQVDDKSLGTSEVDSHEKHLETGLSSEGADDVKHGDITSLAFQLQTTEPDQADKENISIESSYLTENQAAGKARTHEVHEPQDQDVNKLLESEDIQTVKSDGIDKIEKESCKEISSGDLKYESIEAVIQNNVGSDQTSSATKIVDSLEIIPSEMLPKQEDHESSNIVENEKDESTKIHEDIMIETSDASFATTIKGEFLQKEGNKAPESDFRDNPTKEIKEEESDTEASETEPKKYISEIDDPSTTKCEKSMELVIKEKREDEENLNSENTSNDSQQLAISQSLGKDNQPKKEDEKYEEATELLMRPGEFLQSELETESFQVCTKAEEAEMNKAKLERETIEKREKVLVEKPNEMQDTLQNNQSIQKIDDKNRSTEDSSCSPSRQQLSQKTYEEDELKPEVDSGVKADGIIEATNNASYSTKFEEPEAIDATQSFKKQMPTEEKVLEGTSQVSMANEAVNYRSSEEGKAERSVNNTADQDELNTESHPGIKANEISETTNNASERSKFEELETNHAIVSFKKQMPSKDDVVEEPRQSSTAEITVNHSIAEEKRNVNDTTNDDELKQEVYPEVKADDITNNATESTKSFQKQIPKEETVVEGSHQYSTAEEILNNSPAEEEKEDLNAIDTKKKDELKPEGDLGEKADEKSETVDNASDRTKFEEAEIIEAAQSFNKQMISEEVIEGHLQVAEEIANDSPAEEGKEERNVQDRTALDELKPDVYGGVKFEEAEAIEATQKFNTQMPSADRVNEGPPQVPIANDDVNCTTIEERKEEKFAKDATGEEFKPEVDPRVKLEETEITDATRSFKKQIPSEDKVVEVQFQVPTAEEIVNDIPEEGRDERNFKDTATQNELNPVVAQGMKPDKSSETMKNASESTKFQNPVPIDATQSFNKQITSEGKVAQQPQQESIAVEIEKYHPEAEGKEKSFKDITTLDELKPKVEPRTMADEISQTTHHASESTKFEEPETVDATQKHKPREDNIVEAPSQVSTTEKIVNYSPAEEEKEQSNVKDTRSSDELQPEADSAVKVDKISQTINNASESTKLEEHEVIDIPRGSNKEMPIEDKVVEWPPQVSNAEDTVNHSLVEEGKAERGAKDTTTRDELKTEVGPTVEVDDISETTRSSNETIKVEVPETKEALQRFNTEMPSEDKVFEAPLQVSIPEDVGKYSAAEERNDERNVNNSTEEEFPEVDTERKADEISETTTNASQSTKLEETDVTDATQSFEKQIWNEEKVVKGSCQVSTGGELVKYSLKEEGKEESNVMDSRKEDELKFGVHTGIKEDEMSETMKSASGSTELQEPDLIDTTQNVNKQITKEDKVVQQHHPISTAEEIKYYHLAEREEKKVKDTTTSDELKLMGDPRVEADEISENTHYASENTKFEEPETVDAPQSSNKQMPKEDKVIEGPSQVSITKEIVNYSPAEEAKEERNVKDTTVRDELKPNVDPAVNVDEITQTIKNASFEECELVAVTQSFNKQMPIEDNVVERSPQVSSAEEIVNHSPEKEGKTERNVKDTTTIDELKTEVDPKVEVDEISETTRSSNETIKFEVSEAIEATEGFNTETPSADKVFEAPLLVSVPEDAGKYSQVEESKEERNVNNTTGEELAEVDTRIKAIEISETTISASQSTKLEETNVTDATQSFEKEIPYNNEVVEGSCKVLDAEEIVECSFAEEGKEERNIIDSRREDELKPVVYPGVKEDEISETMKSASRSTELQEPQLIDATQNFNKQITSQDKVVEQPNLVSTAEIESYHLAEGDERKVKDTTTIDELKPKVDPGVTRDDIYEIMHHSSESKKLEESETVDATQKHKPREDNVVSGPSQISTTEKIINYSPAEEEKEERNVKDSTFSDELKPEIDPTVKVGEVSQTIQNASERTKFKEHEIIDYTQSSNQEMPIEDKVFEGPPQVSTAEEIVNLSPEEEGKAERNDKGTTTMDELKTEVDPKIKLEVPETIEAIQGFNSEMPIEDMVSEAPLQVSIPEDLGKCSPTDERNEERNVNNTTGEKFPKVDIERKVADETSETTINASRSTKLEETNVTDAPQSFEKEIPCNNKVVEGSCQVSNAEKIVTCSLAEEVKEERNIIDSRREDELKPKVYPGVKADEISETMKSKTGSTELQEPELMDATQNFNKHITSQDKVVEQPNLVSTAEEIESYHLAEGDERKVKDTTTIDELKPKVDPGVTGDDIYEITHHSSESKKLEESETVDATQKHKPREDNVVSGPSQISTTEKIVNYSPAEEEKEERNVKDTTFNDELKPEIDPTVKVDEVSQTIKNASESTKFEEHEIIDYTQSSNQEMPIEDKVFEGPPQVSTAEEIVNLSPEEEGKAERNDKGTTTTDELKTEVDPKIKFEVPETIEAIQGFNSEMPIEDVVSEAPLQVSIPEDVGKCIPTEERNEERNVNNTTGEKFPEVDTERKVADETSETTINASRSTKLEETNVTDATQSFEKEIPCNNKVVEGSCQVSDAEKIVKCSLAEEVKEERNIIDSRREDELKPAVHPGVKGDEISETMKSKTGSTELQEPELIDATQNFNKQITSQDKVVEQPNLVSTAEEIESYHLAEGEEMKVKDTTTIDELKRKVDPGVMGDDICEITHHSSEITKLEEPETVDATQQHKSREDNVVSGPSQISTMEKIVNYSPAEEEKEERNVKDTTFSDELKPEIDPAVKVDKVSQTIKNASESTKFEEHEIIDYTQSSHQEMSIEDKVFEGPSEVSTAEEIVNHSPEEEGKAERNDKDKTTRDELKTDSKIKVDEIFETTRSSNETVKFEVPETVEAIQGFNTEMPSEDKVPEAPLQVSVPEDVLKCSPTEETNEEMNVNNTTGEKFPEVDTERKADEISEITISPSRSTKLKESNVTDATQSFEKEIPCNNKVVEGSFSDAEKIVKYSLAEEGKEERNIMDSRREDELKLEVYPGVKADEISETMKSASRSTEFQEPELIDATRSFNKQITSEDKIIEQPHQVSTEEIIENYNLTGEEEKNDNDTVTEECTEKPSSTKSDLIPQVNLTERPTEEILPEAEGSQNTDQVDSSIKERAQDELADLTQANKNSEDTDMPSKSSTAMSNLKIMAKRNPETGNETKLSSEKKELSLKQRSPIEDTFRPEIEELKYGDASKTITGAVKTEYGEKEKPNDDCKERTEDFGSTMSAENSLSEVEESGKEKEEQEDGDAQDEPKNINHSTIEIVRKDGTLDNASKLDTSIPLDMKKLEAAPCYETDKLVEAAHTNDSSIETKDLPELQQKAIAESFISGHNEESLKFNEDKGKEEARGKSISEDASMTSHPDFLPLSKNEVSQASRDLNAESKQTIQTEEMKDGKIATSELKEPNANEDENEEGEGNMQKTAESDYDVPVIVEPSRDVDGKAAHKKSHNILSGVGSKVKHSLAKVKKVITGKSSHPKPSSPK